MHQPITIGSLRVKKGLNADINPDDKPKHGPLYDKDAFDVKFRYKRKEGDMFYGTQIIQDKIKLLRPTV